MVAGLSRLTLPGGLRLFTDSWTSVVRTAALSVVAVCLFIAALDLVFRTKLPSAYLEIYTAPLWPRTAWACLESLGEELLYRLGLMSALAAIPALLGRQTGPRWIIAAIMLAQLVNVGPLIGVLPPWGLLRFWLAGCVWGWLYWRHGFASALVGHGTVHLLLDPLLLIALGNS